MFERTHDLTAHIICLALVTLLVAVLLPPLRAHAAVTAEWNSQTAADTSDLQGVTSVDTASAWAASSSGGTQSFDGSSWTGQTGLAAALCSISATATDNVWASGELIGMVTPYLYHWDGAAWTNLTAGAAIQHYYGIFALDDTHAWAVGSGGALYGWTGTGWQIETGAPIGNLRSVFALDENNIWAVGDAGGSGVIWHKTAGLGWAQEVVPGLAQLKSVCAFDANNVFAVGDNGTVARYQGSWTTSTITTADLRGVSGSDASNVWACGQGGEVWHFNGTAWTQEETGTTADLNSVHAADQAHAWAVGDTGTIIYREYPAPTVSAITPATGTNAGTVNVTDLAGTNFRPGATVRLRRGGQADITATAVTVVSETRVICSIDLTGRATGAWDVVVTNDDGRSATLAGAFTISQAPPEPQDTWFLAEGSTAWGFETFISIVNPNSTAVTCDLTYMISDAPSQMQTLSMPATSRATVSPGDMLGQKDFSTRVVCREGKDICADRTMYWSSAGPPEAHSSVGVTAPASSWYLPEGSSAWGFECWLLVQNPNPTRATVTLTYMIEGDGAQGVDKEVPANSRASFNMADDIGFKDASIKVTSDLPVIPERSMYRYDRREGHDSIGTTAPATSYYLAEGTSAWGFTTYVLVQNPGATSNTVTVTYMTPEGPVTQPSFMMGPNSRKTLRVNDVLANKDFSTRVDGSQPLIAERAMYWSPSGAAGDEACHDSIGMSEPHTAFYLPDGQAGADIETWTLVQNPGTESVRVEIEYMSPTGFVTRRVDTIPSSSRRTYNMADDGVQGESAITVTSMTPGRKVMVERAMYIFNRSGGTDTIGGYKD